MKNMIAMVQDHLPNPLDSHYRIPLATCSLSVSSFPPGNYLSIFHYLTSKLENKTFLSLLLPCHNLK
jgi:hypothetical protein